MLALHNFISCLRESSIPSPASPIAHLYLLAIEQERCDSVTKHLFHFQTLYLFFSMCLVSMPPLPRVHSFPINSTINKFSEDLPPQGDIAPVCRHLQVGRPSYSRGLAQDSTQSTVHPQVPSLGTWMHASAFTFSAIILTTFPQPVSLLQDLVTSRFRGKNRSFEARKSWIESQLQHPN